jgi:omega-6 fatty acid desaturase (delta-12 desaturase)
MTSANVAPATPASSGYPDLRAIAAPFEKPSVARAVWQLVNTFVPYALIWVAMYFTRQTSWWLTLPLAVLNGLFLVRIFIIFHDCGHGSFLKSKTANSIIGFIGGLLTFTPYHHWRWQHSVHHATSGNLDARGVGDIWTMTVDEYLAATPRRRFIYRMVRNPLILFVIGPLFLFVFWHRVPSAKARPRERREVHVMSLSIILMGTALSLVFGIRDYLIIQGVILLIGGGTGLWMFYVQHQFEDV